jgi:hypothetical protein
MFVVYVQEGVRIIMGVYENAWTLSGMSPIIFYSLGHITSDLN